MPEKPYTERTGGRYFRNPATGKTRKAKDPYEKPSPPAKPEPAAAEAGADSKKGK